MDKLQWELLAEIQGRWEADLLKSYFAAYGVDVELFQEAAGQFYPTSLDILGRVQIFVSKKDGKLAQKLLKEYYEPGKQTPAKKKPKRKILTRANKR